MTHKKWQTALYDKELASQIAQDYDLNPFAALLATARGLTTGNEILEYFDNSNIVLSNPYDLPDMDKAVERIEQAIDTGESILIFGDYDADGVTATALLYSYLDARGAIVQPYIPDRITEGYGLSKEAVKIIHEKGAKLIVTVDNGVSAIDEANLISELGMDLIITDHHKPKEIIPKAIAVVDPHRNDSNCAYKEFAGVGVAFKLVCALEGGDSVDLLQEFGDLLAIGTIGDIVPLTGENRKIVKAGINVINMNPRTGIRALLKVAGVYNKVINSTVVAFTLAPRINAAGRMGSAIRALELLLTDDENIADNIALEINNENILRRKTEDDITEKIDEILKKFPNRKHDRVLVVDGDGWHSGVIGIVASRFTEKLGRPCIIISREGLTARGSGRSIDGFSLYSALDAVSEYLTHFGGHTLAAGFGIVSDNIDSFRIAINKYAMSAEMPFPIQKIDFKLNPKSIETDLIDALEIFAPYGAGNSQPVFGLFGMTIESIMPVSEGKHTRVIVSKGSVKLNAIIFNSATEEFPYKNADLVDLAVQLEKNEFRNTLSVNVRVVNIRLSLLSEDKLLPGLRLYEDYMRGQLIQAAQYEKIYPERELFSRLYRAVKNNNGLIGDFDKLCVLIGDDGEKIAAIIVAVDVMKEMNLITNDENGRMVLNTNNSKVNLDDSEILNLLSKSFV